MTRQTQIEKFVAEFEGHIAELEALLDANDDAYILAWGNGLCVGYNPDTKVYFASDIKSAEVVANSRTPDEAWAFVPQVKNGHGEAAVARKRQAEIARQIDSIRNLIANVEET